MKWAALALLFAGCGDNLGAPRGDGGSDLNRLEILDPPGESIGLAFHEQASLRVLYRRPDGTPIVGAPVAFAPLASASESTGGSSLSASEIVTDSEGIAEVEMVAGAEQVNFRVQASAEDAAPELFYVAVSEGGFTDLTATPEHLGFRADLSRVEVRLYRFDELRCGDLDIDAPPESVFPPRSLDGFGGTVSYRNVTAGEAFSLIAWAQAVEGGLRLAAGCVELGAGQVRAGRPLSFPIAVRDRAPALPTSLDLESVFDASPLADALSDPWPMLACPLGRAQLLIDCALDAQAPDGAIDCVVGGTSPLVADAEAARGMPDAAGCRPPETEGGMTSLDATLDAAIGAPWPVDAGLASFLAAQRAPLQTFTLTSRFEGGDHRLDELAVAGYSIDLVNSDRAVIRQVAPVAIDPGSGQAVVGEHRFTVDYGRFARACFTTLGLEPAGLADRADDLGAALYQSVDSGAETGCLAFSEIVCSAIERVEGCLTVACALARPELDSLLDSWWRALEAGGFDFALSGAAAIADPDGDLTIDSLQGGTWTAEIKLESGDEAELTGSWSASD